MATQFAPSNEKVNAVLLLLRCLLVLSFSRQRNPARERNPLQRLLSGYREGNQLGNYCFENVGLPGTDRHDIVLPFAILELFCFRIPV